MSVINVLVPSFPDTHIGAVCGVLGESPVAIPFQPAVATAFRLVAAKPVALGEATHEVPAMRMLDAFKDGASHVQGSIA